MRLYGTVPAKWVDPWGREHHVDRVVGVVVVVRAGKFPHNNGYQTTNNAVFVDATGATYLSVPPIDYGASGHYLRNPPDVATWRSGPPARAIDIHGEPITHKEDT